MVVDVATTYFYDTLRLELTNSSLTIRRLLVLNRVHPHYVHVIVEIKREQRQELFPSPNTNYSLPRRVHKFRSNKALHVYCRAYIIDRSNAGCFQGCQRLAHDIRFCSGRSIVSSSNSASSTSSSSSFRHMYSPVSCMDARMRLCACVRARSTKCK